MIDGLGAAPTKKARRPNEARLLEREPAAQTQRAAAGSHAERPVQAKAVPRQRNARAAVRRSAEAAARRADEGMTCQSVTAARRCRGAREAKPKRLLMTASEAPNVIWTSNWSIACSHKCAHAAFYG